MAVQPVLMSSSGIRPAHRAVASKPQRNLQVSRCTASRSREGRLLATSNTVGGTGPEKVFLTLDLNKAAWQEPVSFLGGIFAGFLGLSLDQDPLRDWIEQTAADSSGLSSSSTTVVTVQEEPLV
ncbi:hypothetical protein WJX79_000511 [Trebouxia sp. C0005]